MSERELDAHSLHPELTLACLLAALPSWVRLEGHGGRHQAVRAVEVVQVDLEPGRLEGVVAPHHGPGPDTHAVALIWVRKETP